MPRLAPLRVPVTIHFDGEPILAEHGEPAAVSLMAAGHLSLARSPKFHRPRGPSCLRAACDGCLARIDGVPNVMACRIPCREGLRVETQNVVGSNDLDLLRVTDWFFPEGMNHHELFAGVPGVQKVMQGIARRVAGLGKLPAAVASQSPARRRDADVLVVGAGPAGMAAAVELSRSGRDVEVVDDDLVWGGGARLLNGALEGSWKPCLDAFSAALAAGRVRVSVRTTAAGIYGEDVLLVKDADGDRRVEVVIARTLVLAPGAHDGAIAFEGNDVPGIMSARAACRLLTHRVSPGSKVVVARIRGGSAFGRAYAAACPDATIVPAVPRRALGIARVKAVAFEPGDGPRRLPCDALIIDAPCAPAYELCAQAGATLSHGASGFRVLSEAGGRIRDRVFVVGEAAGTRLDPAAIVDGARDLAGRL